MQELTLRNFKEDKAVAKSKILCAIKKLEDKYDVNVYRVETTAAATFAKPVPKTVYVQLEAHI